MRAAVADRYAAQVCAPLAQGRTRETVQQAIGIGIRLGLRNRDIARLVRVHRNTVSNWRSRLAEDGARSGRGPGRPRIVSAETRDRIIRLRRRNASIRRIAAITGVSPATVCREIRRAMEETMADMESLVNGIKAAYRRARGARLENLMARGNAHMLEELAALATNWSEDVVVAAVELYLADDSDYLRRARWPLALFLRNPSHYIEQAAARDAADESACAPAPVPAPDTEPEPEPETIAEPVPAVASTPSRAPSASEVYIQLCALWSEELGGELPVVRNPLWDEHLRNPDFYTHLREIVSRARRLSEGDHEFNVSIPWLFRGKGAANWVRLLSGDYNWAMREEPRITEDHQYWHDKTCSRYDELRELGYGALADQVLASFRLSRDTPLDETNAHLWEPAARALITRVYRPHGLVPSFPVDSAIGTLLYGSTGTPREADNVDKAEIKAGRQDTEEGR